MSSEGGFESLSESTDPALPHRHTHSPFPRRPLSVLKPLQRKLRLGEHAIKMTSRTAEEKRRHLSTLVRKCQRLLHTGVSHRGYSKLSRLLKKKPQPEIMLFFTLFAEITAFLSLGEQTGLSEHRWWVCLMCVPFSNNNDWGQYHLQNDWLQN